MTDRRHHRPSSVSSMIFGVIVVCFIAATGVVHARLRTIDRRGVEIAENVAPGIEHLAAARAETQHVQRLLRAEVERRRRGEMLERRAVRDSLAALDDGLTRYAALPLLASKEPSARAMLRSTSRTSSSRTSVAAARGGQASASGSRP